MDIKSLYSEKKNKYFMIVILIFTAFVVRCVFFNGGIRGSDAYAYARYSYEIATCQYHPGHITDHFGFRYTVLAPTALSYAVFGIDDLSSSLFPFLFSIINILIIFKIGEKLYDIETSILACLLLVFYPLDILCASCVGPDSFTPLLSSLAIFLYLSGSENGRMGKNVVLLMTSGVIIGIAVSARETSIFLYGVLVLYHVLKRKNVAPIFWISIGACIPIIAEMTYYYIFTGNGFLRFEILDNLKIIIKQDYQKSAGSLLYYPRMMFGFELQGLATYGLTWWLTVSGLLLACIKRDSRNLLPSIWFILPFLGFEFGLQSFKEMIMISKNYNYLALITPPAMLLSSYFLNSVFKLSCRTKKRASFLLIILIGLGAMNLYGTYRLYLNVKNDAAPYIEVANYLRDSPSHTVYTHHFRWPLFLGYYLRYDPSYCFRIIDEVEHNNMNKISNAYIIFHKRYIEADTIGRPYYQKPFYAKYMQSPPRGWVKVLSFNGKPEYNSVVLYYAK